MHKNTTKCIKTLSKWCKNKHGASKIIDTFETYQWLVSNDWECLMCHWKNHALFLSYRSIILWYSSLMLYLGWLGTCLHHVITKNQSPQASMIIIFWLVISLYDLINNILSLCMIMAVIALLVGRSQSLASLHLYWVWALLVHPTPKYQSLPMCPPYLPIGTSSHSK
jgi:hypothetical protein